MTECQQQPVGGRVFIPEKGLWVSLWNYRAWGLLPCRLLLQSHCVATEPQCLVSRHSSQRALHTRCPNSQSLSRGRLALSLARSQAQLLRPAFLKPGVGADRWVQPATNTHHPHPVQCPQNLWVPFWIYILQEALTTFPSNPGFDATVDPDKHSLATKEPPACSPSQHLGLFPCYAPSEVIDLLIPL